MRRAKLVLTSLFFAASVAWAQTEPPITSRPAPGASINQQDPDRYRRFIENTQDSDETRIAHAEELLLADFPGAADLAVELISNNAHESTQMVMAKAVAIIGRGHPDRFDRRMVAPLMTMLVSGSAPLSSAAVEALAVLVDEDVVTQLSDMVADASLPNEARLAAVEVLARNADRRLVVGKLVGLMEVDEAAVRSAVSAVLQRLAPIAADDVESWRHWWEQESQRDVSDWLRRQARHFAQRVNQLNDQMRQQQEQAERQRRQLATRLAKSLAQVYRLTPPPEREGLLVDWLKDPQSECRVTATELVAERISEGNLPGDILRQALVTCFGDAAASVRKSAVEIVAALNDPADAANMLSRLAIEQDDQIRETILRALGKLGNTNAIAPLVAELSRAGVSDRSVAAAVESIGILAARGTVPQETVETLVEPLKSLYAARESTPVRAATLGAMASIGSPHFAPEFEANLSASNAELLLQAIQGIAVVENGKQVERLTDLLTHPDVRVRQRAMEAVGVLGRSEQLAAVVSRLSAAVEPNEGPREAAWTAFCAICKRLPIGEQVAAADRLSEFPQRQIEYLRKLYDSLAARSAAPPEFFSVGERLARLYNSKERYAEALPVWRLLCSNAQKNGLAQAADYASSLLSCVLACKENKKIVDVLQYLTSASDAQREAAATAVVEYLKARPDPAPANDLDDLVTALSALPAESFPALFAYLDTLQAGAEEAPATQPSHTD